MKPKPYHYLATVYTKHPMGLEIAFQEACKAAAGLLKRGIVVYCPIAHSHPIAEHAGLDNVDHDFWMEVDRPMMDHAAGLIVVRMKNWAESDGIREEIRVFKEAGKPIIYVDP